MQRHDERQTIDIRALHAMLSGATTQEVAVTPPQDRATQPVALVDGPEPPPALSPADSCYNDALDPMPTHEPLTGNLWQRWKQWLARDINMVSSAILIGIIGILVVVTLAGVAVAAKELPATPGGYWLAIENNGTVDFLTGIPATNGSFSGLWYSVPPGQSQPTIVAMNGYVQSGVVHITVRDGVQVAIVGRITGTGNHASIIFSFATFHASNWDAYKNALLNRGGH